MVPNGTWWYWKVPSGIKWYQVLLNGNKLYWMVENGAQIPSNKLNLLTAIAWYCCTFLSSWHTQQQWFILAIFEWSLSNQKSGGRLGIKYQYHESYCFLADSWQIKETNVFTTIQAGDIYLTSQTHKMVIFVIVGATRLFCGLKNTQLNSSEKQNEQQVLGDWRNCCLCSLCFRLRFQSLAITSLPVVTSNQILKRKTESSLKKALVVQALVFSASFLAPSQVNLNHVL